MVLLGTDHKLTLAASKQETAAVKKSNNKRSQGYPRAMLCIIRRWSGVLPLVQRIMMAGSNEVIGVSPAQLLFGNSMQLAIDRGFFLSNLPQDRVVEAEVTLSDWADVMFTAQKALLDTAQRLQRQKDTLHMGQVKGVPTRFGVGPSVLVTYHPQKIHGKPPTKLHPRLQGPYLVANVQDDMYSCQNLVTDDGIEDYQVTRLREFRYDERFVDPRTRHSVAGP